MKLIDAEFVRTILKPRISDSHKGTYGHALIVAGEVGKMGAAVICARACLRSGAGLVTINIPKTERNILQTAVPEAMLFFEDYTRTALKNFDSIGIGPGLGTDEAAIKKVNSILKNFKKPIVADADAINILSKNKSLVKALPQGSVLTPHAVEFDRLFGMHHDRQHQILTATNQASKLNTVIVLKGAETFVTDGTESFVNTSGNAGLAKGGSGDALTGIITSFLAQGYSGIHAAIAGVYLHGLAADLTLLTESMESMLITDVINNMGKAFKAVNEAQAGQKKK